MTRLLLLLFPLTVRPQRARCCRVEENRSPESCDLSSTVLCSSGSAGEFIFSFQKSKQTISLLARSLFLSTYRERSAQCIYRKKKIDTYMHRPPKPFLEGGFKSCLCIWLSDVTNTPPLLLLLLPKFYISYPTSPRRVTLLTQGPIVCLPVDNFNETLLGHKNWQRRKSPF